VYAQVYVDAEPNGSLFLVVRDRLHYIGKVGDNMENSWLVQIGDDRTMMWYSR
jgi:hypothetical protein